MASTLIYGSQDAVLTDPGMTADQARALGDWVAAHGPEPDRHLRHPRPRRPLVRGRVCWRSGSGRASSPAEGTIAQMRGSRRLAAAALGQGVRRDPDVAGHRGRGAGQPLHARGPRPRDRRGRPHRQRRHDRPARPGPRPRRRRRRDLQRRAHVPRPERDRRRLRHVAGRDRQGRGPRAAAHRLRPPEQGSSTTTPSGRSPRPASTSTTPRSSCGPRPPRSTSSTPRSSATRTISGGPSCGRAPAGSTASARTPTATSPRSCSAPGSEARPGVGPAIRAQTRLSG